MHFKLAEYQGVRSSNLSDVSYSSAHATAPCQSLYPNHPKEEIGAGEFGLFLGRQLEDSCIKDDILDSHNSLTHIGRIWKRLLHHQ